MMKDMMVGFDLYQPESIEGALDLLERFRGDAWVLAGGQDSFNAFKDRSKRPTAVVDLDRVKGLRGIRETEEGLEIGALTTLATVGGDPRVGQRFPLLAVAASKVASPQIRNAGTLGGNLCQDTQCWYYRGGLPCYRAGGNVCYADTPVGVNREHAIFGADRCVAVSPSDTAPALVALDAQMVVRSSGKERIVPAEDFFVGPALDIQRMTDLGTGEILSAIRLPDTWSGARSYFEKVADRKTWDFALLSVAATIQEEQGLVRDLRLVCGAAACVPLRLRNVEDMIRGRALDEGLLDAAAQAATRGARPLRFNGYKLPLLQNLVRRALRA